MNMVKFNDGNRSLLNPGFNDIFESFFNDSFLSDRMMSRIPAVNVGETDREYQIEMAAPGLKKEDFKLSLDRNLLHIAVEKKDEHAENNKHYNKREYNYTSFVRTFALPDSADDARIDAEYHDGVLKINVAKKEEAKIASRQIAIK
jgi:HSP20 family protein